MPIGEGYTLLERAVYECAMAGCHTIWITVNDDWQKLIKKRIGDYVEDPLYLNRVMDRWPSESKRRIYIYYVPELARYRTARYGDAWGIINSAIYATRVAFGVGSYTVPSSYYAAFPMGLYEPELVRQHRQDIKNENKFYIEHDGNSIKTGHKMGFSFSYEDMREINCELGKRRLTGNLSFTDVYNKLDFSGVDPTPAPWYNEIESWPDYAEYMASNNKLDKPDIFCKAPVANVVELNDE